MDISLLCFLVSEPRNSIIFMFIWIVDCVAYAAFQFPLHDWMLLSLYILLFLFLNLIFFISNPFL